MGCFSFLCKKCGKGIQSTSFSGHKCNLFLLKDGKVIQKMSGEYDSYGRVFKDGTQNPDVKHDLRESEYWKSPIDPEKDENKSWSDVCDLLFDDDKSNGIAAYHQACYEGEVPTTRSYDDPNQGWGEDGEDFADLSTDKYSGDEDESN